MSLFFKKSKIENLLQKGGNFTFIALNFVTIFNSINNNKIGNTLSYKQKLVTMSLFDMYQFLIDGNTDAYEVTGYTKLAINKSGYSSVNEDILNITCELLKIIFSICTDVELYDIKHSIQEKKPIMKDIIDYVLDNPDSSIIKEAVDNNVNNWLNDMNFLDIMNDAIDTVWKE